MAENPRRVPNVLLQPASVDFIHNRLPELHPAFEDFRNLQYDPRSNRFVSTESIMLSTQEAKARQLTGQKYAGVPVRELVPAVSAMKFWNRILDKSMIKFMAENIEVPRRLLAKSEYAIRGLASWVEIHKRFQLAMEVYDGKNSKVSRITKRIYREVADNSGIMKIVTDLVPDGTYVTPVKTAIIGVLDVGLSASKSRSSLVPLSSNPLV
jgi:hypothetical protein